MGRPRIGLVEPLGSALLLLAALSLSALHMKGTTTGRLVTS